MQPRWQIMLMRRNRPDRRYVMTLKAKKRPISGQAVVIRDTDGRHVTGVIRSFKQKKTPPARYPVFAVEVDEIESIER